MSKAFEMLGEQYLTESEHSFARANLSAQILQNPRQVITRRRRVRYTLGAVLGLAIMGAGTATAVVILQPAPVTDHHTARCYQEVSTNFGDDFPGITVAEAVANDNATDGEVRAPIQVCAATWEAGAFPVRDYRAYPPPSSPSPVPELIGCVLPDGTAAVFPGNAATCDRLGLPVALPE